MWRHVALPDPRLPPVSASVRRKRGEGGRRERGEKGGARGPREREQEGEREGQREGGREKDVTEGSRGRGPQRRGASRLSS
jgi:hypothetical protein